MLLIRRVVRYEDRDKSKVELYFPAETSGNDAELRANKKARQDKSITFVDFVCPCESALSALLIKKLTREIEPRPFHRRGFAMKIRFVGARVA